jgi:hypothetical protein
MLTNLEQDIDGLLTYDEFLSVVRLADGLRSEREIVRMYREALLLSPDGENTPPKELYYLLYVSIYISVQISRYISVYFAFFISCRRDH